MLPHLAFPSVCMPACTHGENTEETSSPLVNDPLILTKYQIWGHQFWLTGTFQEGRKQKDTNSTQKTLFVYLVLCHISRAHKLDTDFV